MVFVCVGYYAFIETSAPRQIGDKAVLTSMQFDATTGAGRCISFWYHMYGASVGTLNIFQKTLTGTTVTGTLLLWQLKGNQGNQWLQGRIPLNVASSYQVCACWKLCILSYVRCVKALCR